MASSSEMNFPVTRLEGANWQGNAAVGNEARRVVRRIRDMVGEGILVCCCWWEEGEVVMFGFETSCPRTFMCPFIITGTRVVGRPEFLAVVVVNITTVSGHVRHIHTQACTSVPGRLCGV